MERPKLLLPWKDGTILDHVLAAWSESQVDHVLVVVRREDRELADACKRWPVAVLQPVHDPPDMKSSVMIGLRHLEATMNPISRDRCFIAPADLPTLKSDLINRLMDEANDPSHITVPCFGGKLGHPALFPWPMTRPIFDLPDEQGINQLVKSTSVRQIPCEGPPIVDVDTPEEYREVWRKEH